MAWTQQGNLKGPKGDTGDQGPKGDKGDAGTSVAFAGTVATYADLPTGLGAGDAGDGYLVDADGLLYVWSGTAFPANGAGVEFRGPQGPAGADGTAATITVNSVTTGPAGSAASVSNSGTPSEVKLDFTIPRGDKGNTGDAGPAGTNGTRWFSGTGAPGTVAGAAVGDFYLDLADGTVYVLS